MKVHTAKIVLVALFSLVLGIASSHCQLEVLPAFDFLCCTDAQPQEKESSPQHCEDDACKTVENGFYFYKGPVLAALKMVSLLPFVLVAPAEDTSKVFLSQTVIDTSPQAPPSWRFAMRTALPVRAPSFVS